MSLYARGTFTGRYEASSPEELAQGQYVIGHEFGVPARGHGLVNLEIAKIIANNFADLPLYVAGPIARALQEIEPTIEPAGVFNGTSADTFALRGGTWQELEKAVDIEGTKKRPILVGQAFHIGRAALHARRAGLDPLVPEGLPTDFAPGSKQWWCDNPIFWAIREAAGVPVLRLRGQI